MIIMCGFQVLLLTLGKQAQSSMVQRKVIHREVKVLGHELVMLYNRNNYDAER